MVSPGCIEFRIKKRSENTLLARVEELDWAFEGYIS